MAAVGKEYILLSSQLLIFLQSFHLKHLSTWTITEPQHSARHWQGVEVGFRDWNIKEDKILASRRTNLVESDPINIGTIIQQTLSGSNGTGFGLGGGLGKVGTTGQLDVILMLEEPTTPNTPQTAAKCWVL